MDEAEKPVNHGFCDLDVILIVWYIDLNSYISIEMNRQVYTIIIIFS